MSCGPESRSPGWWVTRRGFHTLAGGLLIMAMIPENPVVGGTVLERAAIRSPNFVTTVSGWTINQDGSAEFNNVTIRNGQIISGTSLYYSGTPAAGNLVASIAAAAGTDSFGNFYLAGVAAYATSAPFAAVSLLPSGSAFTISTATVAGGPWTTQARISGNAAGNLDLITPLVTTAVRAQSLFSALFGATVAGGLTVTGGETADTVAISSAQAAGLVLNVTDTTSAPTAPISSVIANAAGDNSFGIKVAGDTSYRLRINSDGSIQIGPGNATQDVKIARGAANLLSITTADVDIATAGRGLQIKEGTNARMGLATLTAGAVTVANTSVTANTRIFLTEQAPGGTAGFVRVSGRVAGTSFSIASSSTADTSTVAWLLVEPG